MRGLQQIPLEFTLSRVVSATCCCLNINSPYTGAKARRAEIQRLDTIPDDEERLVLATGRYIGEEFDDARLDTLFLALPVSWKGTLIQYAGRLHRLHPEKTEVRIYDYVDRDVPMLARMFEKRLRGYRAIGYSAEIASAP
jgi:superfamily II DNA or RNA helicase